MPYVQRSELGKVKGRYAVMQPGIAEEWVDDGHPDLADKSPEQVAQEEESDAIKQLHIDAKATAMYAAIQTATLAQIDSWIDTNFPALNAQQRALLKVLAAAAGAYLRERNVA